MADEDTEEHEEQARAHHLIGYAVVLVACLALAFYWPVLPFGLLGGILFGLMVDGCMRPFLKRGWRRGWTLLLILGTGLPILAALGWWAWPTIIEQFNDFVERMPSSWGEARVQISRWPGGDLLLQGIEYLLGEIQSYSQALGRLTSVIGAIMALGMYALLMMVLGVYLAITPEVYLRGVRALTPARMRGRLKSLQERLYHDLQRWVLAQLLSMSMIAVSSTIGLWILGVPLALFNGLLAGLLTFIPNFGPTASVIPPVILALGISSDLALWVVVLYIGLQSFESYLLTPLVMHRVVFIPPAMVLFAQLTMWTVFGFFGLLFAVPATIVLLDSAAHHREELGESDGTVFE